MPMWSAAVVEVTLVSVWMAEKATCYYGFFALDKQKITKDVQIKIVCIMNIV